MRAELLSFPHFMFSTPRTLNDIQSAALVGCQLNKGGGTGVGAIMNFLRVITTKYWYNNFVFKMYGPTCLLVNKNFF